MKRDAAERSTPTANHWHNLEDKKKWTAFLKARPELAANFTQSYNWGVFQQALGRQVFYRARCPQKKVVAGYIAILEEAKLYKFLSITGGPLLDWHDEEAVESFLRDARFLAAQADCTFIRFRPAVADQKKIRQTLKKFHVQPSPAPFSVELAGILDLNLSDEELASKMSQSLRRKIRKAQADKKIEIRTSQKPEDAQEFAEVHQQHAQKMRYVPFSKERIIQQFETFAKDDQAILYLAKREGQLLAANMIFFFGVEASYHFGVSTSAGQKYSSAPLLHLAAIAEARRRQLTVYNFWGITKKDEINHRYYGLSQFKRSFGVLEHQYVGAHDIVCRTVPYFFLKCFETRRRRRRRL